MSGLYRLAWPLLRRLDAETAHRLSIKALGTGLWRAPAFDSPRLACRLLGLDFANPIGMAAGYDKDAEVPDALLGLGFGFAEVGSVTPRPQAGNPRPRLFRLLEDRAVINRMGFNNRGLEHLARRLEARPRPQRQGIVGVNLGANGDSDDRVGDYVSGLKRLQGLADYLVVNVSSPNTPGLRDLQAGEALAELLDRLLAARTTAVPLFLKVSPDLAEGEAEAISEVVLARAVDGLVISNTTLARQGLRSRHCHEAGGLSGAPLFEPSTALLARFYRLTGGRLALIGVGGVANGRHAYAKIRAGASLVQLYTALVYQGPGLIGRLKCELAALLEADGFAHVGEAVGLDAG
ncbi:MAG TPA: quinone-dependent dihydroorotate dehydrogenase [Alphaproteobacteria bacterium]|jgi:dihydroorotate dehydrogenase|nr:quinone-dependent dihydroorotate dehydrogenase [Alphaproteobacteria bacterium]MDP6270353.1 quinone-dependent dihydroorotate dehydrogenase [Alphaproteobacteria bacterium]MDP7429319.1 quinone-dependent dihydroorotate dehydrogenase [Alphaproteobacteria bacterium]HJM49260.1 quinone-dependent dihydroorotate dehydrogenase [Alphaproteobacteria bacterium]